MPLTPVTTVVIWLVSVSAPPGVVRYRFEIPLQSDTKYNERPSGDHWGVICLPSAAGPAGSMAPLTGSMSAKR